VTLDLSLQALVDSAGALAFVVVGGLVAASSGPPRARWLLAVASALFGLTYVWQNILIPDSGAVVGLTGGTATLASLATLALAWELTRGLGVLRRGIVAALAVASIALALAFPAGLAVAEFYGRRPLAPSAQLVILSLSVLSATHAVLLGALGLLAARSAPGERRGLGLLALGFGAYVMFNATQYDAFATLPTAPLAGWLAPALVAALLWVPASRRVALALLGIGASGEIFSALLVRAGLAVYADLGADCIARILGALAIVIALLRHELLGLDAPRFAIRRGPLAAGALATLFIVAQVAQNFFAAQYGLLLGGVVAGAFLFMAAPLQRAVERMWTRPAPRAASAPALTTSALAAYRASVRAALADGAMTPQEEEHLAEAAHHLGLSPLVALRIRREVEREPRDLPRKDPPPT
jgi:hypothetical protein